MPRPEMRKKKQLETENKKRSTTTGNSTQDDDANSVPPHDNADKKKKKKIEKKNNSKNQKKNNSMASIEKNQMNQANSTLIASLSNSTTAAEESSSSSSSETIFSKAIKGFTFFKQKNIDTGEEQDTANENINDNSNKSIRGQSTPSQAPTIMIHNNDTNSNNSNLVQQQQTIPNCTSSYISCYSQSHPAFTVAIINTILLFLYYIFCSKRKYSRKWRPHNKTRDAKGEYSAVQVYDTLLDDFDDGQFSVNSSVYDEGDDSSESIGSVISQWSDIGNRSRGERSRKSGTRSVEMTIMGDDHLAMEEMNG